MTQERRGGSRVAMDVHARILNEAGEVILGDGRVKDLSAGGTKLITPADLEVGELLQLEFVVRKPQNRGKDRTTITCEVRTVWKSGKEESSVYGVKFINLSPITKELIARVVYLLEK